MINTAGPPIDEATVSLVKEMLVASATSPHTSLQPALNAFVTAFQQWHPKTILDIQPSDKPVLDFLFSTVVPLNNYLFQCRTLIHQIVATWLVTWNQWTFTTDMLQSAIDILQTDLWDTYQDFHLNHGELFRIHTIGSIKETLQQRSTRLAYANLYLNKTSQSFLLSSVDAIQCRIDDMNRLPEQIQEYLSVDIHGKTYQLDAMLSTYYATDRYVEYNKQKVNTTLQQKIELLQKLFGPKPDLIYHLTYFNLYRSILFDDATINREKRFYNMERSLSKIKQSIGATMTYDGVVYALTKLNSDALLNSELQVLLSNEQLEITAMDVTNFRAVKLLYDISKPIQGFINTCKHYNFHVVDSDATFSTLQHEVTKFYASKSNDCQTCLSFLDQLYNIFCRILLNEDSNDLSPHISLLHKINELTKLIPILLPLSYISHGPNLWHYFREMGWFKNGIFVAGMKFDEDYNSLTSALSGFGAIQEALIVDVLKPVARLIIALQTSETCPSIKRLLSNVQTDNTIRDIMLSKATIQADIHKLNSRVLSIKELFRNVCNLPTTEASVRTPPPTSSHAAPTPQPVQTNVSTAQPQQPSVVQPSTPQPSVVQSEQVTACPSNTFGFTVGPGSLFGQPKTTATATNPQLVTQPMRPIISQPTTPPSFMVPPHKPTGTGQSSLPYQVHQRSQVDLTHFATPQESLQPRPSETAPSMTTAAMLSPTVNGRCTINVGSKITMNGLPLVIAPEPASAVPQPTILPPSSPAVSMSTTPPIQSTTTQPSSASGFTFSMDSGVNLNGIYIFQFGSSAPLASTPPLSPPPDPMTQAPAASTAVPPPNSGNTFTFGSGAGGFQVGSSRGRKLTPRFRRR